MSLQDVPLQHAFWLLGGKHIKNIVELGRELKHMSSETFVHHVNEQKNDFANWVEHCAKDNQLAILLRTTKSQERMAAIVERRIQELTRPRTDHFQRPPRSSTQFFSPSNFEGRKTDMSKAQARRPIEPSIIRTKNVTLLNFKHEFHRIKTRNVTPLLLAHKKEPNIIKAGKTTKLIISERPKEIIKIQLPKHPIREIFVHEVKKHHYSATLLFSHIILGIVFGVAITILVMAFK